MLSELHQVLRYDNLSGQPLKITRIHIFGLHAYTHACMHTFCLRERGKERESMWVLHLHASGEGQKEREGES